MGRVDHQLLRYHAAQRDAKDMSLIDLQRVHQPCHIPRHVFQAIGRSKRQAPLNPLQDHVGIGRHIRICAPLGQTNIAIVKAAQVDGEFHARFSATERNYLYRIIYRRAPVVFDRGWVWQIGHELNLEAMQEAATYLIGNHDFTTFRSVQCQAQSPVKTLDALNIIKIDHGDTGTEYQFRPRARSFLHNQVRSFVGTLERVGAGGWTPEDLKVALDAKDRAACGTVAPPDGLYLTNVVYPKDPFA